MSENIDDEDEKENCKFFFPYWFYLINSVYALDDKYDIIN